MIQYLKYYLTSMYAKGYVHFAVWLTVFRELFTKYVFNDWEFLGFLFVLIVGDTFFAMLKVIRTDGWRALSFKESERILTKCFLYFGVLVLAHVLGNFTIHGKPFRYYTWIDTFLYSYMVGKEALSVARNINAVKPDWIPQFVIDRLNKFQKTGKASDLLQDEERQSQPPAEKTNT